jgi:hypothetical protein
LNAVPFIVAETLLPALSGSAPTAPVGLTSSANDPSVTVFVPVTVPVNGTAVKVERPLDARRRERRDRDAAIRAGLRRSPSTGRRRDENVPARDGHTDTERVRPGSANVVQRDDDGVSTRAKLGAGHRVQTGQRDGTTDAFHTGVARPRNAIDLRRESANLPVPPFVGPVESPLLPPHALIPQPMEIVASRYKIDRRMTSSRRVPHLM